MNSTGWIQAIVAVQICGDYSLQVDEYPLSSFAELFASMAGGEKFAIIDLSKAYLQLEVHPDDRHLLMLIHTRCVSLMHIKTRLLSFIFCQ